MLFLSQQVAYSQRISSEGCLEELFRKCPRLKEVDLRHVQSVRDRTLLVLTEYCRHLKKVLVEGCHQISMESLMRLQDRGVILDVVLHRASQSNSRKIPGQI